jgi:hypothetical protein
MHISSLIFLLEVKLPSAFDRPAYQPGRHRPALRDEVGELIQKERDTIPHFASPLLRSGLRLHYQYQHFVDGLFREQEIPHSSTLSFYFPMA